MIKIHKYSYPKSFFQSRTASMAKSKQSAESKQTADHLKNHKLVYRTCLHSFWGLMCPLATFSEKIKTVHKIWVIRKLQHVDLLPQVKNVTNFTGRHSERSRSQMSRSRSTRARKMTTTSRLIMSPSR